MVKDPYHRANITKLRISSHNLYVERGRYENPIVPREDRWCTYCYTNSGQKHIENEDHVLFHCPLYQITKTRILHHAGTIAPANLKDLLNYRGKDIKIFALLGRMVHEILEINKCHTTYYNCQGFHTKMGDCVIL